MIQRTIPPAFQTLKGFEVIPANPVQLDNGIDLHTINAGTQDILKIDIIFQSGIWFQPEPLTASFTNSMLAEGTKKYSSREIAEKFDFYGSYYQPSTEMDNTIISVLVLHKFLDETLEILEDIIKNPVFPESEFFILRNKRRQSYILDSDKTKVLAKRKFQEHLFGKECSYANKVLLKDFDTIHPGKLKDYHQKLYHPGNVRIIASGKVNDRVIQKINQFFGQNWKKKDTGKIEDLNIYQNTGSFHVEKKDALQSSIRIGKLLFNKKHPDFLKMQIVNTILGGYFGSRLMSNIREDKGYTYGIGSIVLSLQNSGFFVIVTDVGTNVTETAVQEIYAEIERLRNEKVPEEELVRVKNYVMGEMLKSFDGPFALSDTYRSILEYQLSYSYFDKVYHAISSITPEEVLELAQKYLDPGSMLQVIAGKNSNP